MEKEHIMNIQNEKNGTMLTLSPEGKIDTTTAPELDAAINESIPGVQTLVLDFSGVSYISSAGLRVLLSAQKKMNAKGTMVIRGANEDVKDIFALTGFADILTIE